MEARMLRFESSVTLGRLKLAPLVKTTLFWADTEDLLAFNGSREAAYIAVADGQSVRLFSVSGDEVSLKQVKEECRNCRIDLAPEPEFRTLSELT